MTSPITVQKFLKGAEYPAGRDDLLAVANANDAPEEVIAALEELDEATVPTRSSRRSTCERPGTHGRPGGTRAVRGRSRRRTAELHDTTAPVPDTAAGADAAASDAAAEAAAGADAHEQDQDGRDGGDDDRQTERRCDEVDHDGDDHGDECVDQQGHVVLHPSKG